MPMSLPVEINVIGIKITGHSTLPASFCPRHGNHRIQGAFRIAGLGSFVTFLAHQEK
jgi:hypothetical protein